MTLSAEVGEAGPLADDLDRYRNELRAWLRAPELDPWRNASYVEEELEEFAHRQGLTQRLYDAGWSRYGYPPEAGGLGGDARYMGVLHDELAAADLPIPPQVELLITLGPVTAALAPHLAARYLPAFLRGDEWWAQGFSEPEAGSDLASLRCRATRRDDSYVVSGQKLWTSHGYGATRLMCLVRTGTPESRHRGLSMILIDADSPGVTVRPVLLASGRAELAECFFDDVEVPADRLIGAEGEGWAVAMWLLQYERAVYAWERSAMHLARLRELVRLVGDTEEARRVLGGVYLDILTLRARSVTTVRRLARGETIGPESSVDKILLGTVEHSVLDAARTLLGPRMMFGDGNDMLRWRNEWWYSRATTIFGGSAEVQRGIVADHLLKLPKG
jgi:alkylation response protein AidB-like acyl-CoA dehydrogenase